MARAKSMVKQGADVIEFAGAHIVAPATIGALVFGGIRAAVKGRGENGRYEVSVPWALGGAGFGLAANAGVQYLGNRMEAEAVAEAEAKAQGKATA